MRLDSSNFDSVYRDIPWKLKDLCEWLCPALDVDLYTEEYGNSQIAVASNDWETLKPEMLLRRLVLHGNPSEGFWNEEPIASCLKNITTISNDQGQTIARAFLWPKLELNISVQIKGAYGQYYQYPLNLMGVITDGPFRGRTRMTSIGLWRGRSCHVSRNDAEPFVTDYPLQLMEWATRQSELINSLKIDFFDKIRAAEFIRATGANTGPLPIAIGRNGPLSFSDITKMQNLQKEIILFPTWPGVEGWELQIKKIDSGKRLHENAFGVLTDRMRTWLFLGDEEDPKRRANHPAWKCYFMSIWGAVIEAIAIAWNVSIQEVLEISDIKTTKKKFTAVIGVDRNGNNLKDDDVDILRKPS
jgi:hypothetical protein